MTDILIGLGVVFALFTGLLLIAKDENEFDDGRELDPDEVYIVDGGDHHGD